MVTHDVRHTMASPVGSGLPHQRYPCPVCASERTFVFLHRSNVPVHQHLVLKDQKTAANLARADLNFVCCDDCGFVFNDEFDPSRVNYSADYDNSQMYSAYFKQYIDATVQYLLTEKDVRNCRIVEVGCGNGQFLRMLVENDAGNTGFGFDPAYTGAEVDLGGRVRFQRSIYGPDSTGIPADVVLCRHLIEHVSEPEGLIRSIRKALSASPRGRIFFETPSVEWILRNHVIWDFFYEHSSLFSGGSLSMLCEHAGFKVETVRHIFGGQYLWLEARSTDRPLVTRRRSKVPQLARQFGVSERGLTTAWQTRIRDLARTERIAICGAGAKGVTFANLMDPNRELITCVVDLNPRKQGSYLPGTGHPIVDYRALADLGVTTAVLMNPNYREETREFLRQAGLNVGLLELQ